MALQALEGLSDREAISALRRDIAWKVACAVPPPPNDPCGCNREPHAAVDKGGRMYHSTDRRACVRGRPAGSSLA
jgi:hypothetical protein